VRRASDARRGKGKGKEGTWKSNRIAQFWTQHVTLTVPQRSNRDHFGTLLALFSKRYSINNYHPAVGEWYTILISPNTNYLQTALERTLLAYIRTSVVIAMQGVLIAQLFRLQQPSDRLKFYVAGKPLAVTCHCVAILVALIGAYRFWRQQGAISAGKVHAGGWELNAVGILICAVSMGIG
jgi:uncharacterized membrane protein YidH (DUF202 family)